MFRDQCFNFQTDQFIKSHIQNGIGLIFRKAKITCHNLGFPGFEMNSLCIAVHQTTLCLVSVTAASQDLNDQIDHIASFDQTFLNFFFSLFFFQQRLIFAAIEFKLEINIGFNDLL